MNQEEINKLEWVIDQDIFLIYLALADLYEENGNLLVANGYRWLSVKQKFPKKKGDEYIWGRYWNLTDRAADYSACLPRAAFNGLLKKVDPESMLGFRWAEVVKYPKASEAIRLAAEEVGKWLKKGDKK